MAMSEYFHSLRALVGSRRLLLPSVTALIFDDDALLLVRQREGSGWSTPGGAIDPDGTPADAVVREAWEETGLVVSPDKIAGVFGGPKFVVRYPNGHEAKYVLTAFMCTIIGGHYQPDGNEVAELDYWRRDQMPSP